MVLRATQQTVAALGSDTGALRATQQTSSALGSSAGALRGTQQTVCVLGSPESVIAASVTQSLGLTQDLDWAGPRYVQVAQTLEFQQSENHTGPIYDLILQNLNLQQMALARLSVINLFVQDTLEFEQRAGRVFNISVTQTLDLTDDGERTNIAEHTLEFVQIAVAGRGRNVIDTLELSQSLSLLGVYHRPVVQNLGLKHALTYTLLNPCTTKEYTPFVGETTDDEFTAPTPTPPTLDRDRLSMWYPFDTQDYEVELRNPSFGNRDRLIFNRINRITRGGTLVVFADPKWPKSQILNMQFDALKASQVAALKQFLALTLGQEIGLKDYEGRVWRGIITTPDAQFTHVGRFDQSVVLEFQGELA